MNRAAFFSFRGISAGLVLFILFAGSIYGWAATTGAVAKAPPLPPLSGTVVRVSTAAQIVAEGEKLAPGATMVIEPGVYVLPRPLVLREKRDITIRSASGDPASVVLQGKGWDAVNERDDIIHAGDCKGVLIAGLTFAECHSHGIKVEAERGPEDVHIFNCRFRDIGVRAIKGSAGRDAEVRARSGSVRFCDFENTKIPPANWYSNGDYIGGIDMMALENWTFSDNVFRNIKGRNGGGRAAIFIWVRSRNILTERNLIINCDRGISFGNPGQSTANKAGEQLSYVSNGIIQNNLIAGGPDCGIELWHVEGIKVRQNSIWRPKQNWGRGIRVGSGTARSEIVNNLVHGEIQVEGGQADIQHNAAGQFEGYFEDPSVGNLALKASAVEAIDQGAGLNSVPYDARRLPRKNVADIGALEFGISAGEWIPEMQKVHARFKGAPGTFLQIGDSITYSGAFWSPLLTRPNNISKPIEAFYQLVKSHLKPEWFNRKGPANGNQGSMTVRWGQQNLTNWLAAHNPEVALVMFGSNDVGQMEVAEYEKITREVIEKCLANGTIVILTTAPPQISRLEKCLEFADAIRRIAAETKIPLIDYCDEILSRRPFDWDGGSAEFKNAPGDTYEVLTLISRDGVHPSNPKAHFNDFSEKGLNHNGFTLRNYLTMNAYADVIKNVLQTTRAGRQP